MRKFESPPKNIIDTWPEKTLYSLQRAWRNEGLHYNSSLTFSTKLDRLIGHDIKLNGALNLSDIQAIKASTLSIDHLTSQDFKHKLYLLVDLRQSGIHLSMDQFLYAIQHSSLSQQAMADYLESTQYGHLPSENPSFKSYAEAAFKELLAGLPCLQAYSELNAEEKIQLLDKLNPDVIWHPDIARVLDDCAIFNELDAASHPQGLLISPDALASLINGKYFTSNTFIKEDRSTLKQLYAQVGKDPHKAHHYLQQIYTKQMKVRKL